MKWEHCYASLADQSLSLPRFGHSAVAITDANGNSQVVIYGGVGCNVGETAQTALGDVAVLQVDSGTWSAADILPDSTPGPRAFHSAVAQGGRMLVFGGHILTFDAEHNRKRRNFFNDIWQLHLEEWQWSKVPVDPSSSSPAKRDMAALLLLSDDQLLLFGGRSEAGKHLQDTWLFNIPSNTWEQLKPVGALPPPRKMHTMAKVGSQVVLFGGEADNGPQSDVWVLGGFAAGETLRWTPLQLKASPAPRFGHAMAAVAVAAPADGPASRHSSTAGSTSDQALEDDQEPTSPFVVAAAAGGGAAAVAADGGSRDEDVVTQGAAAGTAGSTSGSLGGEQHQQQQQQRVVVFGGCLDLSSFLSLNKNYVQSKETWVLQLDTLTWLQLQQPQPPPAAAAGGAAGEVAAPPWPCERMCHSLTALPDGQLLVIGGRNKEGICRDTWLLDTAGDVPVSEGGAPSGSLLGPPVSPRPSTAGSTGSAAGSTTPAATKPSPSRPGSQSLLQSLLGPVRARVPSQSLLARRDSNPQPGLTSTPPSLTPSTSQPASPKRLQQPPQDSPGMASQDLQGPADAAAAAAVGGGGPAPGLNAAADGSAAAAAQASSAAQQQGGSEAQVPAAVSSSQQPLATLMDVSSGEFAKLLRNPAAYSAGAIGKLSSSVTSTVSSLLVGKDGQPGPMLPRLPDALMRVAPSWAPAPFGMRGSNTGSTSSQAQQHQGTSSPALFPLRQQMGLLHGAVGSAHTSQLELRAPTHVLQELAALGQQLLTEGGGALGAVGLGAAASGSFASNGSIPTDVLVAAARQHLMAAEATRLQLSHVALLLADYQQLAASYYAHMMLSRLSEGFSAAVASAGALQAVDGASQAGSAFLQRQPKDLLINHIPQLQLHYRRLLLQSASC